ncbi:MAG: aminoacyl-tRNA hydrolase [Gemmatimonadetes bacterium]|nr:aminoacyl-tRNA hydrolase [Gemmatimonadota bacterium]
MRLILALGNPGHRYRDTRHNVGWWLADRLARRWECSGFVAVGSTAWTASTTRDVEIHKPLTFMNRSGDALVELRETRDVDPLRDLLVVVDDVALGPGRFRMRGRGSAGGHNGLSSIAAALGTEEYARLRIGVGRRTDDRIDMAAWVLAETSSHEEEAILGAFGRAAEAVEHWLDHDIETTMSRFNSR